MNENRVNLEAVSDEARTALRVSSDFEERCVNAALTAYSIAKMRQERGKLGAPFLPLAIEKYVQGLGGFAKVAIESALKWAGISEPARLTRADAAGWTRLLRRLEMRLEEIQMLARISFAEQLGVPLQMAVARAAAGRVSTPGVMEAYRSAAADTERDYPVESRSELDGILEAIEAAYRAEA